MSHNPDSSQSRGPHPPQSSNGLPVIRWFAVPAPLSMGTFEDPPRPHVVQTAHHPAVGTRIDSNTIELTSVLGYSNPYEKPWVVYRAIDLFTTTPDSRLCVVKCLIHMNNAHLRRLHTQEIALHRLVSAHPNIITLHRVIEEEDYTFAVMDDWSGGDLFSQILHERRHFGDDNLIKHIFLQLLDAVKFCHSLGIYHRDLKPENVFCFDEGRRLVIANFALATTETQSVAFDIGDLSYMSPECKGGPFAPTGTYSTPCKDIWSLGVILLEVITGRKPWKSASLSDPTFQQYWWDPDRTLHRSFPISVEVNKILLQTFDVNWSHRIGITELRRRIDEISTFYADDAIKLGMPRPREPSSGRSADSIANNLSSALTQGDSSLPVSHPTSGATRGVDSGPLPLKSSYGSTQHGNKESMLVNESERPRPHPPSISTARERNNGGTVTARSITNPTTTRMHPAPENHVTYPGHPSFSAQSSPASAFEVGVSNFTVYNESPHNSMGHRLAKAPGHARSNFSNAPSPSFNSTTVTPTTQPLYISDPKTSDKDSTRGVVNEAMNKLAKLARRATTLKNNAT